MRKKYELAVTYISEMVKRGALQPGRKVPSIRKLSRQLSLSPITVQHAYEILEADQVIFARPRSGYYVCAQNDRRRALPSAPAERARSVSVSEVSYAMTSLWHRDDLRGFGGLNPHMTSLRLEQAHRCLRNVSRQMASARSPTLPQEGGAKLRQEIVRHIGDRGHPVAADDILVCGPGMHGFDICLDMVAERGDTVILDTPTYLPLILSLQSKGLRVLEVYSHPAHGIDPDQFAYLLANYRVKAAILSPLNHFPTGRSSSPEVVTRLAAAINAHGTQLIEFGLFADLTYSSRLERPLCAQCNPEHSMLFGSFVDTLGPDLGLSWIICPGRIQEAIERKFLANLMTGDGLVQLALGDFLGTRQYIRAVSAFQKALSARAARGGQLLKQHLPKHFTFSQPDGGYMCWVRGPSTFDAVSVSKAALHAQISLLPGPIFSPSNGFGNFIGVNISAPWVESGACEVERLFQTLARS